MGAAYDFNGEIPEKSAFLFDDSSLEKWIAIQRAQILNNTLTVEKFILCVKSPRERERATAEIKNPNDK